MGKETVIPGELEDKMTSTMKGFVLRVVGEDSDEIEMVGEIKPKVFQFIDTNSIQERIVAGLEIIDWLASKNIILPEQRKEEVEDYMRRQFTGRGIKRIEDISE